MISSWKKRIDTLNKRISVLEEESLNANKRFEDQKKLSLSSVEKVKNLIGKIFSQKLEKDGANSQKFLSEKEIPNKSEWLSKEWDSWKPKNPILSDSLYVGKYTTQFTQLSAQFEIPAYIPFIGKNKTVFINSIDSQKDEAFSLMHGLAIRIALLLPHQTQFTFLDPSGLGSSFPFSNQLTTRESSKDPIRVLEVIIQEMKTIISTYGLSDRNPFHRNAKDIMVNEQLELIFAANFPKGYDRRTIEKLQSIGNRGPISGKYLFIHHNEEIGLPRDININDFENRVVLNLSNKRNSFGISEYHFVPDTSVPENLQKKLLTLLKNSKPPERKIDFEREVGLEEEKWWSCTSEEFIETSIGRSGSSAPLNVWFGAKESEGGRPCAHGMLAAMTGAGKSNLYHVLIMGFCLRYSTRELALYLIDGKDGVEFQPYKHLPHAEFVSLKSQPQLSRSILSELVEEKERRNEFFGKLGVSSYEQYRAKKGADFSMPRILLLVDEYQELFIDDKEGLASAKLQALAEQGRSVGIHMLLGSQRFGVVGMLHQSAIFGNIHLRIAMKMALADRNSLTEFGREGKQRIATCNLPGKLVLNDQSGDDGANKLGKVALLSSEVRDQLIQKLITKTHNSPKTISFRTTNIFNGNAQPELLDNPQLDGLLHANTWKTDSELEEWARLPVYKGGLGEFNWFSGEKPLVAWLGQEFNVRGYASITLRRRQRENVLIVGDRNEGRYGMLNSIFISLLLSQPSNSLEFYLIDRSIPKTPWSNAIPTFVNSLGSPLEYKTHMVTKNKDIANALEKLREVLTHRANLDEQEKLDLPSIILTITEADRIDELLLQTGKHGFLEESPLGKTLNEIIKKGPSLGLFVVLSFEGVMQMTTVLSKRLFESFRHRIALQMSEDDAFTFVRNREASRLQTNGPKPLCAVYQDIGSNKQSIFKPYVIDERNIEQIENIKVELSKRIQL